MSSDKFVPSANLTATLTRAGEWWKQAVPGALRLYFGPPTDNRWPRILTFIALAALGVGHWFWFFGSQPLDLDFEDWPKERAYLDVMREALTSHQIPFHMDYSLQMTTRFLAIPETLLGPQTLALRYLTNSQFIVFQTGLMFLLGLLGCWQLARRFNWSAFAFLAFTVVFSFNGFITARLAVGHFMWAGYYLFPWMLLTILRLLEAPGSTRRIVELSWVIFALFLVGSFHLAVWWMLFLFVLGLGRPKLLWPIGWGLALTGLLCIFRVAPAAITFGGVHRTFGTGYPDLLLLGKSLVARLTYDAPFVHTPWIDLGWWEFDHFVGLPAVVFTVFFALRRQITGYEPTFNRRLLMIGAGVLAVLSLSFFYALVASLPLPLFNTERITTRFISIAFFVALFCACDRFNRDATLMPTAWKALAGALLIQTMIEYALHSAEWRLPTLEASHPPSSYWKNADLLRVHIEHYPKEARYKLVVLASWTVSAVSLLASTLVWRRAQPAIPEPRTTTPW
jgi:hypothetical protein